MEPYYPVGVTRILATGGSNYIGLVDPNTVLKFPHDPQHIAHLKPEAAIYTRLGTHLRILGFKGKTDHGLLLERANGASLGQVLRQQPKPDISCLVLYCDLNVTNILLDGNSNVLLGDFEGRILNSDGTVTVDSRVSENAKARRYILSCKVMSPSQSSTPLTMRPRLRHVSPLVSFLLLIIFRLAQSYANVEKVRSFLLRRSCRISAL